MVDIRDKINSIDSKLTGHMQEEETELKKIEAYSIETRELTLENSRKIDEVIKHQQEQKESLAGLLKAWETGSGFIRFVKWVASIGTALYFFIDIIKGKT